MNADSYVLGNALGWAAAAFAVNVAGFRWVPDRKVLIWLLGVCGAGGLFNVAMSLWFWKASGLSVGDGLLCLLVSGGLYTLFSFAYFVFVIGPYESSIRLRLVRELAPAGDGGLTREELLARYNARQILAIRLDRLTGSGEVIREGETFRIGRTPLLFLVLYTASVLLGRWAGLNVQTASYGEGADRGREE